MMPDIEIPLGSLRWPVKVARRRQGFETAGTGMTETWIEVETVRADIQPISAMTFYSAEQVDTPVTHRITLRWLDYLDQTHAILRSTRRVDLSVRTEVFRVRRVKELNGRKRFSSLDCELERVG
jgi:head-tail adaptor